MLEKFLKLSRHLFVVLCATSAVTAIVIAIFPAWHRGLVNLLHHAWLAFLQSNSTNTKGFFSPILVSLASVVLTLVCIGFIHGRDAMLRHWWENTAITALVTITVLLVIYGPQFVWSVVGTIDRDHQSAKTENERLRNDNASIEQLRSERDALKTTNQKLTQIIEENKKPQVTHYWLKMEPVVKVGAAQQNVGQQTLDVLILTDGKVSEAKGRISCGQPFTVAGSISLYGSIIGVRYVAYGLFSPSHAPPYREVDFNLLGGNWNPGSPLVFTLMADEHFRPGSCEVSVRESE